MYSTQLINVKNALKFIIKLALMKFLKLSKKQLETSENCEVHTDYLSNVSATVLVAFDLMKVIVVIAFWIHMGLNQSHLVFIALI